MKTNLAIFANATGVSLLIGVTDGKEVSDQTYGANGEKHTIGLF